jgi:hypothetical protein
MRTFPLFLLLSHLVVSAVAQSTNSFPLWPNGVPGALGTTDKDIPTLTAYLPAADRATGAAMVICPGGGYGGLANHEGEHYARFLNESGIAGFVLKYRLGSSGYRHPAMLQDAARAIRTVRARVAEWKLDPKRVGIMGSSAGGHLASTLLTHFDVVQPDAADAIDGQSSRPDLGILCYAVITMGQFTHQGSKNNLLGKDSRLPPTRRPVSFGTRGKTPLCQSRTACTLPKRCAKRVCLSICISIRRADMGWVWERAIGNRHDDIRGRRIVCFGSRRKGL